MVDHWYEWLFNIFERNFPKQAKHRVRFHPWVSKETSNLIKRGNTQQKLVQRNPSESNQTKLTSFRNLVNEQKNDDQRAYEESVFKMADSVKYRGNLKASENL